LAVSRLKPTAPARTVGSKTSFELGRVRPANGHGLPTARVLWAAERNTSAQPAPEAFDFDACLADQIIDYDAAATVLRQARHVEDPETPPVSSGPFG
jgi:hypothetical protein